MKDQASIFPCCLPLSVSLLVLSLPLSTLFSASLSLSLSFFLCLFLSLGVLQAVDHINSTVAPALVGSVRISLCSPLSNAYSGRSLSPDLCLCLSSSHWVNRHTNAFCKPGHTPPAPHATAIFSLGGKDLTLPGPPQHLCSLTSPLGAPCRAHPLFQLCSPSSTESHPHVCGLLLV